MKKIFRLLVLLLLFSPLMINAQGNPPPNPNGGNDPGGGNDPVGGRAPVGGGIGILLTLGVAYGARKIYLRKKKSLLD